MAAANGETKQKSWLSRSVAALRGKGITEAVEGGVKVCDEDALAAHAESWKAVYCDLQKEALQLKEQNAALLKEINEIHSKVSDTTGRDPSVALAQLRKDVEYWREFATKVTAAPQHNTSHEDDVALSPQSTSSGSHDDDIARSQDLTALPVVSAPRLDAPLEDDMMCDESVDMMEANGVRARDWWPSMLVVGTAHNRTFAEEEHSLTSAFDVLREDRYQANLAKGRKGGKGRGKGGKGGRGGGGGGREKRGGKDGRTQQDDWRDRRQGGK